MPRPPPAKPFTSPAFVPPSRIPGERGVASTILALYRQGWFPMFDPDDHEVHWVQPDRRGIIPLEPDRFIVSRSLRAAVRSQRFIIRTDTAFSDVIRACAEPAKGRESTWIDGGILEAFESLHRLGHVHSVEAWRVDPDTSRESLVGGLYGLSLGRVFCGESMFSRPALGGRDASKVCLVHLVHHLRRRDYELLDAQMINDHLLQFGTYEMSRREYTRRVARGPAAAPAWMPFEVERTISEMGTGERA